jgi:DhnA family fructose-bisphosphate aldolase class Ia
VLRPLPLPILLALSACAPAATTTEPEKFVLADLAKYKTEAERARAQQLAETDCKAKAIAAGAAIEKSIASERNSLENLSRAREKAAEMSATTFTLCMLNNGYIKR